LSAWPFILFAVIFAVLTCAHFFLAYRAWRISRGEEASDIDPNYVRLEDYLARSFRAKVAEWLEWPVAAAYADGSLLIPKGQEHVRVCPSAVFPARSSSEDILVVQSSFRCLADCVFGRELYVRGDAEIGTGTRLQAIAVDGDMTLGRGVAVARWADSRGDMDIGMDCVVHARATAGKTLCLGRGAQVGSAHAAAISTVRGRPATSTEADAEPNPAVEVPPADAGPGSPVPALGHAVDLRRMTKLGTEGWLYEGDFEPAAAVRTRCKLIVRGNCMIPAGSVLENDLKAKGAVHLGAGSVCKGNVIADGDIVLGVSTRFYGIVHAGKTLTLDAGVRGGREDVKVAAFAAGTLRIADDVIVHGKVASADRVVAAPAAKTRRSAG
jgi:predicted acyltransferase (DUF342 family)